LDQVTGVMDLISMSFFHIPARKRVVFQLALVAKSAKPGGVKRDAFLSLVLAVIS
jgi:hypothetical protein